MNYNKSSIFYKVLGLVMITVFGILSTTEVEAATARSTNKTLHALWKPLDYSISYDLGGVL